ncbi:hypothetical protein B484DRAFT_473447, partial [Ochromonadaceae sp. CCMP2298]
MGPKPKYPRKNTRASRAKPQPAVKPTPVRFPVELHAWGNAWAEAHQGEDWKNTQGVGQSAPPTTAYCTVEKLFIEHYPTPLSTNWQTCGPEWKKLIYKLMYKKCQGKEKTLKNAQNFEKWRTEEDALRAAAGQPSRVMENRKARDAVADCKSARRRGKAEASKKASKKYRSKWAALPKVREAGPTVTEEHIKAQALQCFTECRLEQLDGQTMKEALDASKDIWDACGERGTSSPAEFFYLQYTGFTGRYLECECISETTKHLYEQKSAGKTAVLSKTDGTRWGGSVAAKELQPEVAILYETNSTRNARNFEGALHQLQEVYPIPLRLMIKGNSGATTDVKEGRRGFAARTYLTVYKCCKLDRGAKTCERLGQTVCFRTSGSYAPHILKPIPMPASNFLDVGERNGAAHTFRGPAPGLSNDIHNPYFPNPLFWDNSDPERVEGELEVVMDPDDMYG